MPRFRVVIKKANFCLLALYLLGFIAINKGTLQMPSASTQTDDHMPKPAMNAATITSKNHKKQ